MNVKQRRQAIRAMATALLQSGLSAPALRQLAEEFAYGEARHDLTRAIEEVADLSFVSNAKEIANRSGKSERFREFTKAPLSEQGSRALKIVAARKLSRQMVQQLIDLVTPGFSKLLPMNASLKDMLEAYFSTASRGEADRFLGVLSGEPADAYLKGISKRL